MRSARIQQRSAHPGPAAFAPTPANNVDVEADLVGVDADLTGIDADLDDVDDFPPLYARVLRLRHLRPNGLTCLLFFEGSLVVGGLLALAELIPWWGMFVLAVAVAAMVKVNDVVAAAVHRSAELVPEREQERFRWDMTPAVGRTPRPVIGDRPVLPGHDDGVRPVVGPGIRIRRLAGAHTGATSASTRAALAAPTVYLETVPTYLETVPTTDPAGCAALAGPTVLLDVVPGAAGAPRSGTQGGD
ncbi:MULTISPECIES: hypothetical protein [unclassified Solwaraspora]|uniref:hypothetical protein n=1 Tax=unclassified Solwaraspora TaxID=2627926 RepID=UPI00259BC534|nr:hypothetical protein [Solwaraspora sp. WMMA2056]WJK43357.1 hypothetical protein O7608_13690 [Solwaraspora sp. WMMA2056]